MIMIYKGYTIRVSQSNGQFFFHYWNGTLKYDAFTSWPEKRLCIAAAKRSINYRSRK